MTSLKSLPVSSQFRAPAKINWDLYVYPLDECGLHPISSITTTVSLFDIINISIDSGDEIIVKSPVAPGRDNIVWRATQALREYSNFAFQVNITIEKNIPHGAGLGGGSSDAMTVLKALNSMLELGLSKSEICSIGAGIGSDLPLFYKNGWNLVEGFGEKIREIDGFDSDFIIVYSNKPLATADVYKAFDKEGQHTINIPSLSNRLSVPFNALTNSAVSIQPEIEKVISKLNEYRCKKVQMTGSGSAVFGIVDASHKSNIATKMKSLGYSVFEVSTFK